MGFHRLSRIDLTIGLTLCLLTADGCGDRPDKRTLVGKWSAGFESQIGVPGQPLVRMSENTMEFYPDGSLETQDLYRTFTGKWNLHGSTLVLTFPNSFPHERTLRITRLYARHLTTRSRNGTVEEWRSR
jgi:hypothetical protein